MKKKLNLKEAGKIMGLVEKLEEVMETLATELITISLDVELSDEIPTYSKKYLQSVICKCISILDPDKGLRLKNLVNRRIA